MVHAQVVKALTDGFKKIPNKSSEEKARIILEQLLGNFSIDFTALLQQYKLSKKETADFLTYILYEIYFNPQLLPSIQSDSFILTLLLAEAIEEKKIRKILESFPEKKQLSFASYCFLNMREGAWKSIHLLLKIHQSSEKWQTLLHSLIRNYYDRFEFEFLANNLEEKSIDLLVETLEGSSKNQAAEIQKRLPDIVRMILSSAMNGFNEIVRLNKETFPTQISDIELAEMKEQSLAAQRNLEDFFGKSAKQSYTEQEMVDFFKVFGLHEYFLDLPLTMNFPSLWQILQIIDQLLVSPQLIPIPQLSMINLFICSITKQMYAFHKDKEQYIHGLNRIVYSVPTRGDSFETKPWLPSILAGLQSVTKHVNQPLRQYPIIIYDQSNAKQFDKNQEYIDKCAEEYKANIWHISKEQTLHLASKLGIEKWIKTHPKGTFGYGGARNCVFFLSPIIYSFARQGFKNFDEIISLDDKILFEAFEQTVLGHDGTDLILHLSEDDLVMPESNFFSDALFANNNWKAYFHRLSYCMGRDTMLVNPILDLDSLLKSPENLFFSTIWTNQPHFGSMRGVLSKPRFCLPLPFGKEEADVISLENRIDLFMHPNLHLGGTRYPKGKIPEFPLDNVLDFLRPHLVYAIQISMQSHLVDSLNKKERCILPWNDLELRTSNRFKKFGDLLEFAAQKETIQEMQRRFWRNMSLVFEDKDDTSDPLNLMNIMRKLALADLSVNVSDEIKEFYAEIEIDARMFIALGKKALHMNLKEAASAVEKEYGVPIRKTELASGLHLLIKFIQDEDYHELFLHDSRA